MTVAGAVKLTHRQVLIVFSGLMAGMLLYALDQMVVATAMPTIVGELGGLQHYSWVMTGYLLCSTASMPLYGKLSDLYGRKLLLQVAIVVFLLASLLAGLSQNMIELVIFRGLQGLGGGGLYTLSQSVIGDIVSPRERGRYQGYIGAVFAVSSIAGPLIGGFFTDHLSWRYIFYVNLPVGLAAFAAISMVLRLPFGKQAHRIDYLGAALMVLGVSALLLVMTWGGVEYAWGSVTIIGLAVLGVAGLAAFVLQERRAAEPILPLRLFRERTFSISSFVALIVGAAMFGTIAYLPMYLQVVKGASATMSGIRLFPMMAGMLAMSIIAGRTITRMGRYRLFPIVGTGLMAVGALLMSRIDARTPFVVLSAYMVVIGAGMGMVSQVLVLAVQNAVPYRDLGAGTAGVSLFRSLGSAAGVAIFGSVLNNRMDHNLGRFLPPETVVQMGKRTLLSSPERIRALPDAIRSGVEAAFANSLDTLFVVAVPLILAGFVATWLLREVPLREHAHVGAHPEADEAISESLPAD